LPLQLLWINLLTDGPPALALGVDPPDPSLMARPPRSPQDRMLSGRHLALLSARGIVIATAAVGALAIVRYAWHEPWASARASMFTVLVVAHLMYAFVVRSPGRRPFGRFTGNVALILAVAFGIGLQILIVAWPPAQRLFSTAPLSLRTWTLVAALGLAPIMVMLVTRLAAQRTTEAQTGQA
ncbi:MAG: cation-translocating P-type ATPase C-terminal domain-containing protein, partial [Actinomycetota bacterium]|nr:cation-translocating P-type ATPase C-terminal domain-containing protein [Actinomycetota bacterium]